MVARLQENKRVRRNLPLWGRVHIDRQLPFLCIYRKPMRRQDRGTERLIMGQPAYIIASSDKSLQPSLSRLVQETAAMMSAAFGRALILEVWSGHQTANEVPSDGLLPAPAFQVVARRYEEQSNTLDRLENELAKIKIHKLRAEVDIIKKAKPIPPRFPSLIPVDLADQLNCDVIGIEVRPIYRHADTNEDLPLILQALKRDFNVALQRTFFTFVRTRTKYRPAHYQMLGRRAIVKAVWRIDKQLAEINSSFDLLLQATPVNADKEWKRFSRNKFERPPVFRYRPHAIDPALLKRQLWDIRVEQVEDPTLQHLFREKQKELDVQLSMLGNMNRPGFLLGSLQLYGKVDSQLLTTAKEFLSRISPHSRERPKPKMLNAREFAEYAQLEIERYRQEFPGFEAKVDIQSNLSGLLVSHGNLLVGKNLKISARRADALLAHEVGVHSLTYFNGQAQPLKLLYSGLAGYEELQEGLAVLAEYLVGGLSRPRLRLLAARVIAANSLTDGANFLEVFRELKDTYQLKQRQAFNIAMRIYRAGGITKDAIYLRGFIKLLDYLRGAPLHDLFFVGKIALDHVGIIQELQRRDVLQEPAIRPHFLTTPEAKLRLTQLAQGLSAFELIERKRS
ncbi:MAG: flavohemoglobin expression-modulating QEGLA motif protein [Chloroflexi bacterium]|nr:flavohemoglobin expression-modulating QEGLA motif protein [Chloroflexota bacterium]